MVAKISLYVLALCLLLAGARAQKFIDCGSAEGTVQKVELVPPCNPKCVLPRGTNVTVKIAFTSKEDASQVKAVVHGLIGGVPFPFPLPNPDGCTNCGLTCPLKSGTDYQYSKSFEIKQEYPALFVTIKYELVDGNGKDIVCIKFPAQIQ